jgi:DNA repair exonuclease SbcCD ATPase subunit
MRILSTEIQDILSIQSARIDFDDNGLVLVEGWNYDTQRANGAGKTAIFNCLAFSLYDKLPRKITASEILRRGCKSGFVRTRVLCGEDVWTVLRSRPKGVKFFKNDIEQDITQTEFESFLRLSYDQFLLTIYTPQANSRSLVRFLSSPDTDKKEFLLQLLNLNQFGSTKKAIDKVVEQRQAAIDLETNKVNTLRARIETYEESLIDVDAVTASIKTLKESIFPVKQEITELSGIAKPDLSKYSTTRDGIRTKQAEIAQAKAKRGLLHDRYRELNSTIADYNADVACSECGSSLDTPEARVAHADHQEKVKQKIIDIKKQIDDADSIIAKESAIIDLDKKLREKERLDSSTYQEAQARINELNTFVKGKELEMQNLSLKLNSNTELLSKIDGLQKSVNELLNNIAHNKRELEIYKTLSAIYSPTGAQAYVLDSVVDSFNEVIQKYVDMLSPNMSYILNSFKENAKGDVVAKFSETLTKGGKEVSVGSLSGGEEKGLSLCVDFALLEVLETQFGMTLNPIILDEPFDGLDAAGREIVIDLLEALARNRQIFVVDHASESKAMFSKFIRVELRNDISTVSAQI